MPRLKKINPEEAMVIRRIQERFRLKHFIKKQKKRKIVLPPPKVFSGEKGAQIEDTRPKKRFVYYCRRCENDSQSKLPPGEAICVICGSSKIE